MLHSSIAPPPTLDTHSSHLTHIKQYLQMKESWKNNGFVDEPVPAGINLKSEIRRMCQEKNAVILAHYYTAGDK